MLFASVSLCVCVRVRVCVCVVGSLVIVVLGINIASRMPGIRVLSLLAALATLVI